MLTANEIKKLIHREEIAWAGEFRGDAPLLRLGSPLQPLSEDSAVIDLADQGSIDTLYDQPLHGWDSFDLLPMHRALCCVEQPLRLGAGLAAAIGTLSHLARVGLAAHLASPWVMPGWDGYLTLELLNVGPATLRIWRGMPVARTVVTLMDGTAHAPVSHAE